MALNSIAAIPRSHPLLSPSPSHSLSLSYGFRPMNPILTPTTLNSPSTCSAPQLHKRAVRTVDYERSRDTAIKWFDLFEMICSTKKREKEAAELLDEIESEGKRVSKWVLFRVVKQLRKFKKWDLALQVCQWMDHREDLYNLISSDIAIQLDLIAKVHGISKAEDYFLSIPDACKDKRVYGALLNSYVGARMREKAENLMTRIKSLGYVSTLQFNLMMTLYMKHKEYDKVESLVLEMKQNNLGLDLYSYNIWLTARGSQGSVEGMEEVLALMTSDPAVEPNWVTFSSMATFYVRLGQLEKVVDCLKILETSLKKPERQAYHHLLSFYATVGDSAAVHRVWDTYQSYFPRTSNLGYQNMVSSLIRLGKIAESEKIYKEWLSTKPAYDPSVANPLINCHIEMGNFEKAKRYVYQMAEVGGKPNASTWDILVKGHIKEGRLSEALSCIKEAVLVAGSYRNWWPNPRNVALMLQFFERSDDKSSQDALIGLLREYGYWDNKNYRSALSRCQASVVGEDILFSSTKSDVKAADDYDQMEADESELIYSFPK